MKEPSAWAWAGLRPTGDAEAVAEPRGCGGRSRVAGAIEEGPQGLPWGWRAGRGLRLHASSTGARAQPWSGNKIPHAATKDPTCSQIKKYSEKKSHQQSQGCGLDTGAARTHQSKETVECLERTRTLNALSSTHPSQIRASHWLNPTGNQKSREPRLC